MHSAYLQPLTSFRALLTLNDVKWHYELLSLVEKAVIYLYKCLLFRFRMERLVEIRGVYLSESSFVGRLLWRLTGSLLQFFACLSG